MTPAEMHPFTSRRARPRRVREKASRLLGRGPLVISAYDRHRLLRLIGGRRAAGDDAWELEQLEFEVDRVTAVRPRAIPPDVVTMNSCVRVRDLGNGTTRELTLVFPPFEDAGAGRISVLTASGFALLGHRAGDVVRVEEGRVERTVRIEEITYQPEAAGDYHL